MTLPPLVPHLLADASSTSLRWHALPPAWVVVLVIVPAVALAVRFLYRREAGKVGDRPRIAMGALRILAILLAIGALFGPYTETVEGEYFKRHMILLVDTSQSMANRDRYPDEELAVRVAKACGISTTKLTEVERLDLVRRLVAANPELMAGLAEKFRLHLYSFDRGPVGRFEPRPNETPADAARRLTGIVETLAAEGPVTRIGLSLRHLVTRFERKNEPVAGIVLFSDGRHTGGAPHPLQEAQYAAEQTAEGIPIFPVAIGDPSSAINIAVDRIDAPEVALAGDEVAFTVTVRARGLKGRLAALEAWTLDADGTRVDQLPIAAEPFALPGEDDDPVKITFRHRFDEPGRYHLQIGVRPEANEAVHADNHRTHRLRIVKLRMRVLFVANGPSYTYRYLKEALLRAEGIIDAQALLLSAEPAWPQPRTRGRDPVNGFPGTKRELAEYDVVILHDVNPTRKMFAADGEQRARVLDLLEDWVKSGGGLVLHAGRDGNLPDHDGYAGTPMITLLPVVPYRALRHEPRQAMVAPRDEKRYLLTPQGKTHPILRITTDPDRTKEMWEEDRRFTYYLFAPVQRAKSTAQVLAVRAGQPADDKKRPDPLIALQDYGAGKVLWIGTDELWRLRYGVENLFYWRFWANSIRHLATYRLLSGNRRVKIWVDRSDARYQVGETVGVEAKFLDRDFEPVVPDEADASTMTRTLKLRRPDGTEEEIKVHAVITDPPKGVFKAALPANRPGTYSLIAEVDAEEPAEATFTVEDTTLENQDPLMDMRTLRGIATRSHGKLLMPWQLDQLMSDEVVRSAGIVRSGEPTRTDLWDRAWVLWVFAGLLAAEWILRRLHLLL